MVITNITIDDLTAVAVDGNGVFDVLMRANKMHLESEYKAGRIKGTEYSTVYLGSLDAVLNASLQFLLQRQKVALEAQLMEQQVLVAKAEVEKANAQVQVALADVEKTRLEVEILRLSKDKVPAEIAHLNAQTDMVKQQTINLVSEKSRIEAQTDLVAQQAINAKTELLVLQAQKCKLDAEFDLVKSNTLKTGSETALLTQKVATEKAQITALGVDDNSVIGKQKALYTAQTDGFKRDAEQKATKLMVDVWNVQRTTDSGIKPTSENKLTDSNIGRAVEKLLSGISA